MLCQEYAHLVSVPMQGSIYKSLLGEKQYGRW